MTFRVIYCSDEKDDKININTVIMFFMQMIGCSNRGIKKIYEFADVDYNQ